MTDAIPSCAMPTGQDRTPWLDDGDVQLWHGDVIDVLRSLPAGVAQTCVTSPPYWGLRSYLPDGHDDKPAELGLEATPELYVERMVAVFREVWRVLADSGTVWLNLGDSFYSSTATQGRNESRSPDTSSHHGGSALEAAASQSFARSVPGLKPKDLCMIPARVALALQAPWYSGTIKSESDRRWLAAIIDSEGCIYISRSKEGAQTGRGRQYQRTQDAFDIAVKITNTSTAMLEEVQRIVGHGKIRQSADHGRPAYEWNAYSSKARDLLRELYPHFIVKAHEARLAHGCPPSGEKATAAHAALKIVHQGGTPDIDFAAPASMFERGWCLRSDVIWAKCIPNPMPESVSDRPTKAHEYLFLLSKRPRYFWDADAIREPNDPASVIHHDRFGGRFTAGKGVDGSRQDGDRPMNGGVGYHAAGRNRRSVWTIPTQPYPEAHFATFPEALVRPCILAGTSERGECVECGAPWTRQTTTTLAPTNGRAPAPNKGRVVPRADGQDKAAHMTHDGFVPNRDKHIETTGWRASCRCLHGYQRNQSGVVVDMPMPTRPQTVLDPFVGSGTTALVARNHGRRCIGIDLSTEYLEIAARRLQQLSLLSEVAGE